MTLMLLIALICALCTLLLTQSYHRYAARLGLVAGVNERSAHTNPTPTGAGVAIVLVWLCALPLAGEMLVSLLIAGWLIAAVTGFADDRFELPVLPRAIAYAVACALCLIATGMPMLVVAGITLEPGWAGYALGFVALLWMLNLYNFMDGIDGIAIAEAVFVTGAVLVISSEPNWQLAFLTASCLGFAVVNWPPAKVFMGDVGASFLGLVLGSFALLEVGVSVWVWAILLAYFLTDATLTLLIRLLRKEKVYEAHSQHAYQHLSRRFGATRTLYGVLVVDLVWLLPVAFLAHVTPEYAAILLILASMPLLICQFLCGAGQPEPKLEFVKTRGSRKAAI